MTVSNPLTPLVQKYVELDHGRLSWSNELVLHVIELKTNGPAASLDGLATEFQTQVREIN